jgi:hypothetical protein
MKGMLKNTFWMLLLTHSLVSIVYGQSREPAQAILPEEEMVSPTQFEANLYQKYVLNEKQRLDVISRQVEFWNQNDSLMETWGHIDAEAYHASVNSERSLFIQNQLMRFFGKSAGRDVENSINQNLNDWSYSFNADQNAELQEDLLNKNASEEEFMVDEAMYRSLTQKSTPSLDVDLSKKTNNKIVKQFKIKNRFRPLKGLVTSTMEFKNTQMSLFIPINGRFEINLNNMKPFYGFNMFSNYNIKDKRLLTGISKEIFSSTYLRYTFSETNELTDRTLSLSYSYAF